jgi:hypothetical protein
MGRQEHGSGLKREYDLGLPSQDFGMNLGVIQEKSGFVSDMTTICAHGYP